MSTPQLNPEILDVLVELRKIWFSVERNQVEIQSKKWTIERLIRGNIGNMALNYCGRAVLAAIDGNREAAYRYFDNAMRLDSQDSQIWSMYTAISSSLGDVRKAAEMTKVAITRYPDNVGFLVHSIQRFVAAFQISEAISVAQKILKLQVNQIAGDLEKNMNLFDCMLQRIKRNGLDENAMLERLESVVEVVRLKYNINNLRVTSIGNSDSIYELYVDADVAACALMNFEIAEHLVDKFENTGVSEISFMCFPFHSMQFGENSIL